MISPELASMQIKKPPEGGFLSFTRLAFGELLAAPRLVKTHFLAFDFSCIPRNQPCLAEDRFERRIVIDQCARNTMPDSTSLTRLTAAIDVDKDVKRIQMIGQHQRLAYYHATGLTGKKFIDRLVIDDDLAFSRLDEDTGNRALAAAGSIVVLDCCHVNP
jgi:hypothetical protein